MKQNYKKFRQSSRLETGIRSPSSSGFAFAFSPALLEDRVPPPQPRLFPHPHFRGRATPTNAATLNSVDLAEMEKHRGCFFWSGDGIGFFVLRSVFLLVVSSSDISSLRYLGLAVVDRFLPTTSLGGSPLASFTPSALPRRDTSTAVLQHQEQTAIFAQQYNRTTKTRLKYPRYVIFVGAIFSRCNY